MMYRNYLKTLVGYPGIAEIEECFREWISNIRRRKGSINLLSNKYFEFAREFRPGGDQTGTASGEIHQDLEPFEFIRQHRSPGASWLNIKQLTEPQSKDGELISTRRI